jgi:hypothetical protein
MGDFLEAELNQLGVAGTYGLAVTTHTISQKASESRGMRLCGIALGLGQRYQFKAFRSTSSGPPAPMPGGKKRSERESLAYYFKYLIPAPTAIIHAPPRHLEILTRIYEELRAPVELREARQATGSGLVSVSFVREERLGEIRVQRIGSDSFPEVRRARRDLCEIGGAEVVFLDLPLAQAGAPDLCAAARDDGFIFCGIQPYAEAGVDSLRLVYLDVELDLSRIQLDSAFGRELLAYIRKEIDL